MSIVIRQAKEDDAGQILEFITDLARYEKAEDQVLATVETIKKTIFIEGSIAHALMCEKDGDPIGFAVYFFNYSTWQGKKGLYLEDLYVSEKARGSGAGKALMKRLAQIAVENDCGRFEWSVLDWNTPAIAVYEALGAKPKSEWIGYQLTGEKLRELAS